MNTVTEETYDFMLDITVLSVSALYKLRDWFQDALRYGEDKSYRRAIRVLDRQIAAKKLEAKHGKHGR